MTALKGVWTLLLFTSLRLIAQERIIHHPPIAAQKGQNVTIECRIEGLTSSVRFARVYYRESEEQKYKFVFLRQSAELWRGAIPGTEVTGDHLQYFIAFRLENDRLVNFPEQEGEFQPEEIPVRAAAPEASGGSLASSTLDSPFLILAPAPDQILPSGEVLIAISFARENIDPASIALFLNEREVTSFAVLSEHVLTFAPKNLSRGAQRIVVSAKDQDGRQLAPLQQMFFIRDAAMPVKPQLQWTGRVYADGRYENIGGRNESFALTGAEFNGRYGELAVRGRVFLTSLEDGAFQPRHRFTLAVEGAAFTIEAGDIYPRYNDLIIWGKRVRGMAGGVKVGPFTLDAVFGQSYRPVEGAIDATSGLHRSGTYGQNLIGIRPGLSFRPVRFGISLVKIRDDQNSISRGTNPKDNVVIGPDFLLSIDRGRLELRAQAAFSLLTRDAGLGVFSSEDVDGMFAGAVDLPIDPKKYEKIIIINDTTVPLQPQELTSCAFDMNLKLHYYRNLVRLGYKRVGSDYFSLANSWLRKDIRGFYLSDRMRLFQNKLYLTLGLERYVDNFSQGGTKPAVDLNSVNVALAYYPGKGLPNVSMSFRRYDRSNGVTDVQIDSLYASGVDTTDRREDSRQRDLNIQLGYQIQFWDAAHYFSLGYIAAIKDDRYDASRLSGYFSQEMTSNVNVLSWSSTYHFPLRTALSFSTNNNLMGGLANFSYYSLSAFGEYKFLHNRLASFAEIRLTTTNGTTLTNEPIEVQRNHLRAGASLDLRAQQTVTLETRLVTYSSSRSGAVPSAYTDKIVRLRYEKLF
ncbi:hypothetical protein JW998_07115 [candidate division KSB1 bacterium]|nr:hypothetical protein [candidate division KSB1 bacterium]